MNLDGPDSTGREKRLYRQYSGILGGSRGLGLLEELRADQRVLGLLGMMIPCGRVACDFSINSLAMWFLWYEDEHGSDAARDRLDTYLDCDETTLLSVLWVLGIELDEPVLLTNGCTILPLSQMPDSADKEMFLNNRFPYPASGGGLTPADICAITTTYREKKAWPPVTDPRSPTHREVLIEWGKWGEPEEQLKSVALFVNTLPGVCCIPWIATAYAYDEMPLGPFEMRAGAPSRYDIGPPRESVKLPPDSAQTLSILLERYDALDTSGNARMRRVVDRLSQAKRRAQTDDKVLDLGIAMEMLLLDDNRNNDQLALQFRLRGSWLLGDSAEDRVTKFNQLKDFYKYRSQVAHSGVLCNGDAAKVSVVLESLGGYQQLVEDACRKVLADGWPDWDSLVMGAI